jgi:plastocyanin
MILKSFGTAAALSVLFAFPALAANHNVTIQGMKFSPASVKVAVGDTITFTNKDSMPHTATAGDGAFDTGRLGKGKSKKVTISVAGTHAYICTIHPSMKGKVTAK